MSAELQIQGALQFSKGGAAISRTFPSTYFDVSGNSGIQNEIAVGITDEVLALGDITTIGWVYMKNLDPTNSIIVGSDGTLYPMKMKPGEPLFVRWNAAAIHVKANVAPCNMEYVLISD